MFARRQLEQGDSLSQRTFRVRHTAQLRSFVAGADAGVDKLLPADAGDVAFFSDAEAEAPTLAGGVASKNVTDGTCDMMESDNRLCHPCIVYCLLPIAYYPLPDQ